MNSHVTLAYVRSAKPVSKFNELDLVRLKRSAETTDGQIVAEGTLGTVLVTWDLGASYEVEFAEPFAATAIVLADDLKGEAVDQ